MICGYLTLVGTHPQRCTDTDYCQHAVCGRFVHESAWVPGCRLCPACSGARMQLRSGTETRQQTLTPSARPLQPLSHKSKTAGISFVLLCNYILRILRELAAFQARIKVTFTNESILHEAVTHPTSNPAINNARLAALGQYDHREIIIHYHIP